MAKAKRLGDWPRFAAAMVLAAPSIGAAAAAPPITALISGTPGAASTSLESRSFYQVSIITSRRWNGIAALSKAGEAIEGELCLVPEQELGKDRERAYPLHVPVTGSVTAEGALRLATSGTFPEALEPLSVTLKREEVSTRNHIGIDTEFWEDRGRQNDGWHLMYMMHLPHRRPAAPSFSSAGPDEHDDRQVLLGDRTVRDLADYDHLSRDEAFAYQAKHPSMMTPVSGTVDVVVDPEKALRLVDLLTSLGDGARLRHQELAGCGAPFLGLEVEVPPGLEFWYTRQLQRSNLVLTAYPEAMEMAPNWISIMVADAAIASAYASRTATMDRKDRLLAARLQRALAGFALARRPNYREGGSIIRRLNGVKNIFVFELVGRALSTCAGNRWERLLVQFVLQPAYSGSKGVEVSIQIAEAFFAPGGARPADERLDDNRLTDDQLQRLQDMFAGYLLSSGFKGGSTEVPPPSQAVKC